MGFAIPRWFSCERPPWCTVANGQHPQLMIARSISALARFAFLA
jgi:hypothetical protein